MEEQGKNIRIDTESEVQSYIGNFKYPLEHGAQLTFQDEREVDRKRDIRYTNRYTAAELFPDENPVTALKRELKT